MIPADGSEQYVNVAGLDNASNSSHRCCRKSIALTIAFLLDHATFRRLLICSATTGLFSVALCWLTRLSLRQPERQKDQHCHCDYSHVGWLHKRVWAIKQASSEGANQRKGANSGWNRVQERTTYPLLDFVPRHEGELLAAAGLTGQGQCATPNDSAS
jgi:hypothetical protein